MINDDDFMQILNWKHYVSKHYNKESLQNMGSGGGDRCQIK
jgi:hypothetical protein